MSLFSDGADSAQSIADESGGFVSFPCGEGVGVFGIPELFQGNIVCLGGEFLGGVQRFYHFRSSSSLTSISVKMSMRKLSSGERVASMKS